MTIWRRGRLDGGLEESLRRALSAAIAGFAAWIVGLLGSAAALGGLSAYALNVGVGVARWRASTGAALAAALPALGAAVAASNRPDLA